MAPTYRPPRPPSDRALIHELREERERAKTAPFTAACWLSFLALLVPFTPWVGPFLGYFGVETYGLIMLVLTLVLFVRGAVMRGLLTLALTLVCGLWMAIGGYAVLNWLVVNHHIRWPWPLP